MPGVWQALFAWCQAEKLELTGINREIYMPWQGVDPAQLETRSLRAAGVTYRGTRGRRGSGGSRGTGGSRGSPLPTLGACPERPVTSVTPLGVSRCPGPTRARITVTIAKSACIAVSLSLQETEADIAALRPELQIEELIQP